MSLKLTLAALALGLAAATDCCTFDPKGCNCDTEPDSGCYRTGEEPFSPPQCEDGSPPPPGEPCSGGFRPNIKQDFCDPEDYLLAFPTGGTKCQADKDADTPNGVTTFCCGGKFFDITVHYGKCEDVDGVEQCCSDDAADLANCFAYCPFNYCPGKGDASGFDRVTDPEDDEKTICVPITEPPTPQKDEFPCDDPNLVCPVGDNSGCPVFAPVCCPTSSGRRRRRLNFYPSTGCCQETCD